MSLSLDTKPGPLVLGVVAVLLFAVAAATAQNVPAKGISHPKFSAAVASDLSLPLRSLAPAMLPRFSSTGVAAPEFEIRAERGPVVRDKGYSRDGALQRTPASAQLRGAAPTIPAPLVTFEGLSNQDNFNIFGGRVNPPDPNAAVGPNHIVEMVNLTVGVYDKQGTMLLGPFDIGALWQGFAVDDCTDPSGDPVVLYDRFADRWLLSQFTTRGLGDPTLPFYNCVAISATGDPTGAYFRYAFPTTEPGGVFFFPDYPKYSVWRDSYVLTSRDFGPTVEYGISAYALEKSKMITGDPTARSVKFFIDSAVVPVNLIGDGLLPADIDGPRLPSRFAPIPLVGTQDDGFVYGAPNDALNIWDLFVLWKATPFASLTFRGSFPVAPFDSVFPCGVVAGTAPDGRDCLPEPGITDGGRFLDTLSIRQRPTFRLAYRNFGFFESLVTNQSVEARPGVSGVRWYEIVRILDHFYFVAQQGTFAPADGVHRWMGSVAMDRNGNMALGYSVVNGVDVFPGIRYTGRRRFDPPGKMTLGEGTIINGTGAQVTTNSRWGDYTSMNIDPADDCTFWYTNEYYQVTGIIGVNTAPWQTRIGSFRLPGCRKEH
jgi:hypothetical protein